MANAVRPFSLHASFQNTLKILKRAWIDHKNQSYLLKHSMTHWLTIQRFFLGIWGNLMWVVNVDLGKESLTYFEMSIIRHYTPKLPFLPNTAINARALTERLQMASLLLPIIDYRHTVTHQ